MGEPEESMLERYKGRLKCSWTHLITPSQKYVGCSDTVSFSDVPPLASDSLLATLHPLLRNVLQTVCHKLQVDSGTGGFLISELPFHG
jgi:hypothetical protein